MKCAVIRVARKLIITKNESHPYLKQLWDSINNNIEDINQRRSGHRLSWRGLHTRYQEDIGREVSEYGEGILQVLGHRFPDSLVTKPHEKQLRVEMARCEICDFTEEANSLELQYYLVTEPLLLIDNICDRLLVTKKESVADYLNGVPLGNTFTIDLNNYEIVEYCKLKAEH